MNAVRTCQGLNSVEFVLYLYVIYLFDLRLLLSPWQERYHVTVKNTACTVLSDLSLFTMKNGNMTRMYLKEPVSLKIVNACLCYRERIKEFWLFMQAQPHLLFSTSLWFM